MRKQYSIALSLMLILLTCGAAQGQKVNKEVDIMYYFGCHDGDYVTIDGGLMNQGISGGPTGYKDSRWGGNFRIGYQHYITNHLGIGLGLRYSIARLDSIPLGQYTQTISGVDAPEGILLPVENYEHRTVFHDFSEKTRIHALSVPAMIYYQTNLGISWKLYMAGGAMMTFYPKASYQTSGWLETREYYGQYDLEIGDVDHHDNIFSQRESMKGKYTFNPNLSITGELGLLYAINPRLDAYLAVEGSYRLTPMPEKSEQMLYTSRDGQTYTSPGMDYNGMLNSGVSPQLRDLSLGVQLGIRYRLNKEAKIKFQEYQQRRHLRDVDEYEFKRIRRSDFNEMEQRRMEADSAERERQRLEAGEQERIRQQRMKDSLDAIANQNTPDIPQTDTAAAIVVAADTLGTAPQQAVDEIARLIVQINQNYCSLSKSHILGSRDTEKAIKKLSELMGMYSDIKVLIKGHTCDLGTLEQNQKLGLERAEAMRDKMLQNGARPDQIRCESVWWKEPLVPNTSERNRAKNRRAELIRE